MHLYMSVSFFTCMAGISIHSLYRGYVCMAESLEDIVPAV